MTAAIVEEVRRVRSAGVGTADIARATGADRSTVSAWIRDARTPTGDRRDRVIELATAVERLTRVMRPSYVPLWLAKPNEALDDDRPIDLIARGRFRAVARIIAELEEDSFS